MPTIKKFYNKDLGINFHTKIKKNIKFNSYNYFIDEQFDGNNEQYTYKGDVFTNKRRIFTVNNLTFIFKKGIFNINSGIDNSEQYFHFGNISSKQKIIESILL